MADRPALPSYAIDYGLTAIRCPCCGCGWLPNDRLFSEMVGELEDWDRRFDSPKWLLSNLLAVLVDNSSELVPVDSYTTSG